MSRDRAIEEFCADIGMDMMQNKADVMAFFARDKKGATRLKEAISKVYNIVRKAFGLSENISVTDALKELASIDSTVSTTDGKIDRSHTPYGDNSLPKALSIAEVAEAQRIFLEAFEEIERTKRKVWNENSKELKALSPKDRVQRVNELVSEKLGGEKAEKNTDTESGVNYSLVGNTESGIEAYETSKSILRLPWKERKKKYISYIESEYKGRTAKFVRNGHTYYATFDPKSSQKALFGEKRSDSKGRDALINTGADGSVFELVENSAYNHSSTDTKNHANTDYFDYFIKTVQIDGEVFDVLADVKKQNGKSGGYVYSITLVENKEAKPSPIQRVKPLVKNSGNALTSSNSISKKNDFVKPSEEKNSDNVLQVVERRNIERDDNSGNESFANTRSNDKNVDLSGKSSESGNGDNKQHSFELYNRKDGKSDDAGQDGGIKFSTNGIIPKGENPARDIDVPAKDKNGGKVSRGVRTVLEAGATPDSYVSPIMEDIEAGKYSHDVISDKSAQEGAFNKISNTTDKVDKNGKPIRELDTEKYKGTGDKYSDTKKREIKNYLDSIGCTPLEKQFFLGTVYGSEHEKFVKNHGG